MRTLFIDTNIVVFSQPFGNDLWERRLRRDQPSSATGAAASDRGEGATPTVQGYPSADPIDYLALKNA